MWEPILRSDWAKPGSGVLGRVSDGRASQFWDPQHVVSEQLKRAMKADPGHPKPDCCSEDDILWDLVVVYARGMEWRASLPRASYMQGAVVRAKDLPKVLEELLHTPGRKTN